MSELSPAPRVQNGTTRGCLAVIAFLYLAAVLNAVVPVYGYSVHGVFHFLVLTLTTALATATYLQCVYCHPGQVPPGWQPDAEQAGPLQVKRKGAGARFCKKCRAYKPPRTHHCRRCGHCVLRMDHHCAWTNNCIGWANYRAFLLMTVFLAAACLHALGLLLAMDARLAQLALGWEGSSAPAAPGGSSSSSSSRNRVGWDLAPFWVHAAAQVAATALALPVSVGLVVLLAWNAFLALRNQTTIEYHEGVVAAHFAGGASGGHPFDLGWHDNLHAACGDGSPACWLLPGRAAAGGDGTAFPTAWGRQRQAAAGG